VIGSHTSVSTGPASKNVVDLATVKTELGISGSDSDAKLNRLIAAAGAAFSGPAGLRREPWVQTLVETGSGAGGEYCFLTNWPVQSVTSVVENGSTVTASDYSITGWRRDRLYRDDGWARDTASGYLHYTPTTNREKNTVATYVGGWVMPDRMDDWTASTAYVAGDFVRSSDDSDLFLFECTTAGTTDSSEPTWPTTEDGTVADATVTWTARPATEFPQDLREAGLITVIDWFRGGLQVPSGVASERFESMELRYDTAGGFSSAGIPPHALSIVRQYR